MLKITNQMCERKTEILILYNMVQKVTSNQFYLNLKGTTLERKMKMHEYKSETQIKNHIIFILQQLLFSVIRRWSMRSVDHRAQTGNTRSV
jgi:hypothetical protein